MNFMPPLCADTEVRKPDAQLSALHNIRRVIGLDEIPVLGTGKTDCRALKDKLKDD